MMGVLILGEALVDLLVEGKDKNQYSLKAYPGGSPANVAAAVSVLGIKASLVSILGEDIFAQLIMNQLQELGVDLSWSIFGEYDTPLAVIHVDDRGIPNYFFRFNSKLPDNCRNLPLKVPLKDYDVIHCGSLSLLFPHYRKIFLPLIEEAFTLGIPLSLDPNIRSIKGIHEGEYRSLLLSLMERVHLFKASGEDLTFLLGEDYREEVKRIRPTKPSFITEGSHGSLVLLGDKEGHVPVESINVVDTTGCGDAYMGGVLVSYIREATWDFDTALRAAKEGTKMAQEVALYPGALLGIERMVEKP